MISLNWASIFFDAVGNHLTGDSAWIKQQICAFRDTTINHLYWNDGAPKNCFCTCLFSTLFQLQRCIFLLVLRTAINGLAPYWVKYHTTFNHFSFRIALCWLLYGCCSTVRSYHLFHREALDMKWICTGDCDMSHKIGLKQSSAFHLNS